MRSADDVLDFWFGNGHAADDAAIAGRQSSLWWGGDARTDRTVCSRFADLRAAAVCGELSGWEDTARGRLALILLVDQFSRNIFRGDARAFADDALARAWADRGIFAGDDRELRPIQRVFFYLPFEHSESLADQDRCLLLYERLAASVPEAQRELFEGYVDYARRHRVIIARFGRFPHRNAVLGRESSAEEIEFLKQPGSSF